MNLILMRHGDALDVGAPGVRRDADRPLSATGRRVTAAVAQGLADRGVRPDLVLSSPLVRAAQTAEIVARECGGIPVHPCDALAPGGSPADVTVSVRLSAGACVVAVGHMPDLSELAAYLIDAGTGARLVFRKSGVCAITFEGAPRGAAGQLEWLAPPEWIARAGEAPRGGPH